MLDTADGLGAGEARTLSEDFTELLREFSGTGAESGAGANAGERTAFNTGALPPKGKGYASDTWTDLGNARRFVQRCGEDIRYVHAFKAWYIWDGLYWRRDDNGEIMRWAYTAIESLFDEAKNLDEQSRAAFRRFAMVSQSRSKLAAMVDLAENIEGVPLSPNDLDTDPMLLGVLNGTIDLSTGAFGNGVREDNITKRCGVAFDPKATCPNWEAFQQKITNGDADLIAYKQRVYGVLLTGLMIEVLFIMHGGGANGKTTELETVRAIMSDYACSADAGLLVSTKEKGGATPEIVRLKGKRVTFVNETDESDHLNESRVKYLAGNDTLYGRDLYEKPIEFMPTHKPILRTNHKPQIRGTDLGIWRRIHYVPYLVTISDDEKIEHFRDEMLIPELPGILNWMLVGLKDYLANGLRPPSMVSAATAEYRKAMDTVGQWMTVAVEKCPGENLKLCELHRHYLGWMQAEMGWKGVSNKALGDRLREAGYDDGLLHGMRTFENIKLKFARPWPDMA
jgi:putative DNA primase/helicase